MQDLAPEIAFLDPLHKKYIPHIRHKPTANPKTNSNPALT